MPLPREGVRAHHRDKAPLARRDTQWMGRIYNCLGLSIGCIQHDEAFLFDPEWESPDPQLECLRPVERREAYGAIAYQHDNEFGFDYLRDNMVVSAQQQSPARLNYAIVDEVDNHPHRSARTPLMISGQAERSIPTKVLLSSSRKSLMPLPVGSSLRSRP